MNGSIGRTVVPRVEDAFRQTPRQATGGRVTVADLERQAAQIALASRMQGGTETKEQAFGALLEANPEVYAAHRREHNAKVLVAGLEAAGIQVVRK
jgi:hypothetical protein